MAAQLSLKDQFDRLRSTATMIAFTVPHFGPAIAALISGGNLIWDLISDIPQNTDPMAQAPTVADLVQLKADIVDAIGKALVQKDLDDAFQDVVDWTGSLHNAIGWASHDNGVTFMGTFATPADEQAFVDDKNRLLRNPLTPDSKGFRPMLISLERFQNATTFRLKTPGLFISGINCFLLYCKTNMVWDYTLLLRKHAILQDKNSQAQIAAAKAILKYNAMNPKVGPPPVMPPALAAVISEQEAQTASRWVRLMVDELGGPDAWRAALLAGKSAPDPDAQGNLPDTLGSHVFLSSVMALRDEAQAAITGAEAQASKRDADVIVQSDGAGNYIWKDTLLNITQPVPTGQAQAQIGRDVYSGTIAAAIWDSEVVQKGYGDYTQDAMDSLNAIIANWQKALTNAVSYLASYDGVASPPIYDT